MFTLFQREFPATFSDEVVTDFLVLEMMMLLTTYSHRARSRPQVRSESEKHALRCQDFSAKMANIFPEKSLAVSEPRKVRRDAACL
jgi:hypothetical protein